MRIFFGFFFIFMYPDRHTIIYCYRSHKNTTNRLGFRACKVLLLTLLVRIIKFFKKEEEILQINSNILRLEYNNLFTFRSTRTVKLNSNSP